MKISINNLTEKKDGVIQKLNMEKKKKLLTNKEILEKLRWFHGEEINKYPFNEDFLQKIQSKN